MITTVIFDMDDTLYDEVDYCKSGFHVIADFLAKRENTRTAKQIFECLWDEFETGDRSKIFNSTLEKLKIKCDDTLIKKLVKTYREHKPAINLPGDSKNVLEQLNKRYSLALLTDGFLPGQQLKVEALQIEKYFKYIVYTEELGRDCWKPSPVGFEKIIENLNSEPKNTVYVADNETKDFIAPNKLGLSTVQIIRENRIHEKSADEINSKAQCVIRQITQLPKVIEQL